MSKASRRWYMVCYKSKDDPSLGIDYTFSENVAESMFFPTEQSAYAIRSLMASGVTSMLADGEKQTIYVFGTQKVDDYKHAIYAEHEIPTSRMGSIRPGEKG